MKLVLERYFITEIRVVNSIEISIITGDDETIARLHKH